MPYIQICTAKHAAFKAITDNPQSNADYAEVLWKEHRWVHALTGNRFTLSGTSGYRRFERDPLRVVAVKPKVSAAETKNEPWRLYLFDDKEKCRIIVTTSAGEQVRLPLTQPWY